MTFNPVSSHGNGYPLALTGATAATRYVGATASGAPASGTFEVGDFVIDQTGKVYVCTVAGSPGTWTQAGGGATSIANAAPAISGVWYKRTSYGGATNGIQTLALLKAYRIPLKAGTLDRIAAVNSSAVASELCRLGIYADSSGRPGALLVDAGTIDLSAAGGVKSITISLALATDQYVWLASVRQGPTAVATMITFAQSYQIGGVNDWQEITSADFSNDRSVATLAAVTGALPDPFGSATQQFFSQIGNDTNHIHVRYA